MLAKAQLILRATPNPWSATEGLVLFNGSDGFLYDARDLEHLTRLYGEPRTRRTKYGTTYYFGRASF